MSTKKMFTGFLSQETVNKSTVTKPHGIGEELNTPIKETTKPEFNVYTNSTLNQPLKTSVSMLNNIYIANNINNLQHTKQSKQFWSADKFGPFSVESIEDQQLFSPTGISTTSTNSPLGLNSSDLVEESFIYETSPDGESILPIKSSQDYEDYSFTEEIRNISKSHEFEDEYCFSSELNFKLENTNDSNEYNLLNTNVLYRDTMITGIAPIFPVRNDIRELINEDSNFETINNFDAILIEPEMEITTNKNILSSNKLYSNNKNIDQQNTHDNIKDYDNNECYDSAATFPSPPFSPKLPVAQRRKRPIRCTEKENENDRFSSDKLVNSDFSETITDDKFDDNRLHLEHNYNISAINNIDEKLSCKRKLVMEKPRQDDKRIKRVPPLKIKLPPAIKILQEDDKNDKLVISTPEITDNILEMENEKFDLITYVNSSKVKSGKISKSPMRQPIEKPESRITSPSYIEELVQSSVTPKRRRLSYDNPSSVQSITSTTLSDDSSAPSTPVPKRRGRPPKTQSTLPSPTQFKHLSDADWRYMEMRNKNNEASRRSRINRKDRETKFECESNKLEKEYKILYANEQALIKECAKWRRAVMKLAQM